MDHKENYARLELEGEEAKRYAVELKYESSPSWLTQLHVMITTVTF